MTFTLAISARVYSSSSTAKWGKKRATYSIYVDVTEIIEVIGQTPLFVISFSHCKELRGNVKLAAGKRYFDRA
jgi:hypothetical protein